VWSIEKYLMAGPERAIGEDICAAPDHRIAFAPRAAILRKIFYQERPRVMNLKDHYLRMFSYDQWANRECLFALRANGSGNPKVLRLVAHIASAEKLWLERILRQPQSMAVWPSSTVGECAALVHSVAEEWKRFLDQTAPEGFGEEIQYTNSKGEPWTSCVEDILTHVLMHSAYHRGQIALEMRAAGLEPAYTDFIHAVRQGLVEESRN